MPRWWASVAKISSKLDYSMIDFYEKHDFGNVEFQNRGISLNSLRNETKCWKVCEKGANAHFGPNLVVKNKTENLTLGFKKLRHKTHGFLSFLKENVMFTTFLENLAFYPFFIKKFSNMPLFPNYIGACPCFDTQLP